jgi:hypothetical protein
MAWLVRTASLLWVRESTLGAIVNKIHVAARWDDVLAHASLCKQWQPQSMAGKTTLASCFARAR